MAARTNIILLANENFPAAAIRKLRALTRINRLALGNFGDYRALDGGVFELRIDAGPGYRVYAARVGKVIAILLRGGNKKTQPKDIDNAKACLQDYKKRTKESSGHKRAT